MRWLTKLLATLAVLVCFVVPISADAIDESERYEGSTRVMAEIKAQSGYEPNAPEAGVQQEPDTSSYVIDDKSPHTGDLGEGAFWCAASFILLMLVFCVLLLIKSLRQPGGENE